MRKRIPEIGHRRTITRFLIFPKTLRVYMIGFGQGERERRWLERAQIIQIFREHGRWRDSYWAIRMNDPKRI